MEHDSLDFFTLITKLRDIRCSAFCKIPVRQDRCYSPISLPFAINYDKSDAKIESLLQIWG